MASRDDTEIGRKVQPGEETLSVDEDVAEATQYPVGWDDVHMSPHVAQVIRNAEAGYSSRTDLPLLRVVSDSYERAPYRRRKGEVKTVVHWGQRKLLLSEIEFLTLHGSRGHLVVYAGAAPGTHVQLLAQLFPELDFLLVDPAPFTVSDSSNVVCRQELFDDTLAREFSGKRALFISDVRTVDWMCADSERVEAKVHEDMTLQMHWYDIMQPAAAMLKFRLPWHVGETEYLAGDIHLPIWGPVTTTECRLIVGEGAPRRMFNNAVHGEQLFYFNTIARVALYPHAVQGEGLDHCYDCAAEVHVLRAFLRSRQERLWAGETLDAAIGAMTEDISWACARGRTLASGNVEPGSRRDIINRRQLIDNRPAHEVASTHHATVWQPHILTSQITGGTLVAECMAELFAGSQEMALSREFPVNSCASSSAFRKQPYSLRTEADFDGAALDQEADFDFHPARRRRRKQKQRITTAPETKT